MANLLKIVATPIGNIRDISLRAMDEIKLADVIFAEDTRHSLKLIESLGIELKPGSKLISCDSHKETDRIKLAIEYMLANKRVLLLSDAGCPTISDPGSLLVQGVVKHGLAIEIIPGPSAPIAALMGAGIDTTRFAFLGFLPKKKLIRKNLITTAMKAGLAVVIFESMHRVTDLLDELYEMVGERRVVLARELTKLHETFHRGKLGAALSPPVVLKGECVVVVEAGKDEQIDAQDEQDITAFIKTELGNGMSPKDVTLAVVTQFKIKKNIAYDLVLQISHT